MFNEVNRALTDYLLSDLTGSVSLMLDEMETNDLFDGSDTRPADITTIVDESRNIEVARRSPPLHTSGDDKPSLSIFINESVQFGAPGASGNSPEVAQSRRWAVVEMEIRYWINEIDTDQAFRDAYYYARAVIKSIKLFNRNKTARTRNDIAFEQMTGLVFEPFFQDEQVAGLSWAIRLTYNVKDSSP